MHFCRLFQNGLNLLIVIAITFAGLELWGFNAHVNNISVISWRSVLYFVFWEEIQIQEKLHLQNLFIFLQMCGSSRVHDLMVVGFIKLHLKYKKVFEIYTDIILINT
jgi:hypothetical protein